ncbi:transporter substrate-binding domain-containing protein [Desulfobacterales bacterium HSG16]|nr:transporter substrate-binding domain-containing protein [Desulfobacterales bacterium HSG16]
MKKILLFVFVCLVFFSSTSYAEEIIFVFDEYPPYEYLEKGKVVGLDIDIVREVCMRIGFKPVFRSRPWKRCLLEMKNGTSDAIFSLFNTPKRNEFLYYPTEHMFFEQNVILARKERNIAISNLDDLKKLKVGIIAGYSYGEQFDNYKGITKESCRSSEEMLKKLDAGRMDVGIGNSLVCKYLNKKLGFDEIKSIYRLSNDPMYVAFSKTSKRDGETLSKQFSEILKAMRKEGFFEQLEKKYLN